LIDLSIALQGFSIYWLKVSRHFAVTASLQRFGDAGALASLYPHPRKKTRHRTTGGVGRRLSIARTMARSHGGDILVTKREGVAPRASLRRSKE